MSWSFLEFFNSSPLLPEKKNIKVLIWHKVLFLIWLLLFSQPFSFPAVLTPADVWLCLELTPSLGLCLTALSTPSCKWGPVAFKWRFLPWTGCESIFWCSCCASLDTHSSITEFHSRYQITCPTLPLDCKMLVDWAMFISFAEFLEGCLAHEWWLHKEWNERSSE